MKKKIAITALIVVALCCCCIAVLFVPIPIDPSIFK
jgi:hypothetical protein